MPSPHSPEPAQPEPAQPEQDAGQRPGSLDVMRITKFTHACVRLEHDGRGAGHRPGIWAEPESVTGADAILVTL